MAKRIFLFILTNLLVITTIGIVLTIITSVTGVGSYIQNGRIDLMALLVFSLVVGFVGSFISLGMSRWMAKTMMGVRVLNPKKQSLSYEEQQLVDRVHRLSRAAGMTKMPEVGIYHSRRSMLLRPGLLSAVRLSRFLQVYCSRWMMLRWKGFLPMKSHTSQTVIWSR